MLGPKPSDFQNNINAIMHTPWDAKDNHNKDDHNKENQNNDEHNKSNPTKKTTKKKKKNIIIC